MYSTVAHFRGHFGRNPRQRSVIPDVEEVNAHRVAGQRLQLDELPTAVHALAHRHQDRVDALRVSVDHLGDHPVQVRRYTIDDYDGDVRRVLPVSTLDVEDVVFEGDDGSCEVRRSVDRGRAREGLVKQVLQLRRGVEVEQDVRLIGVVHEGSAHNAVVDADLRDGVAKEVRNVRLHFPSNGRRIVDHESHVGVVETSCT